MKEFKIKVFKNTDKSFSSLMDGTETPLKTKFQNTRKSSVKNKLINFQEISKNYQNNKINFFSNVIELNTKVNDDNFLTKNTTKENLIDIFNFLFLTFQNHPSLKNLFDYLFKSTFFLQKRSILKINNSISDICDKKDLSHFDKWSYDDIKKEINKNKENLIDYKTISLKLKNDYKCLVKKYNFLKNDYRCYKKNSKEHLKKTKIKINELNNIIQKKDNDIGDLKKEKFFVLRNFLKNFFKLKKRDEKIFKKEQNIKEMTELMMINNEKILNLKEKLSFKKKKISELENKNKIEEEYLNGVKEKIILSENFNIEFLEKLKKFEENLKLLSKLNEDYKNKFNEIKTNSDLNIKSTTSPKKRKKKASIFINEKNNQFNKVDLLKTRRYSNYSGNSNLCGLNLKKLKDKKSSNICRNNKLNQTHNENNKLEDQLQIFIKKEIKNKKNSFSLCKKELKNEISLINSSYFSLEGKIENLQKLVESFFFIFSETILKIEKNILSKEIN
jgi:hypothetical protein